MDKTPRQLAGGQNTASIGWWTKHRVNWLVDKTPRQLAGGQNTVNRRVTNDVGTIVVSTTKKPNPVRTGKDETARNSVFTAYNYVTLSLSL